ncbi:hypothetical protein BU24DRAFT_428800 [Aaosphaeria arxii CBS 175.79]|uniref:Nudix hydrolase domain-containing protein n=1 Tax=Aaosphaeria arxii CBS 175.79 TaxID=1450172 RepID=A0A6A5X919_9PLEO|nr:uncharacterized protein BU24DRAFT_428800 [Aaosphaeria arxii CBS 175.79]KAF2009254.1 hypothetical protein BU24DRAFT_428800 [Aaosphaeria arxii CBS 175.79]
MPSSGQRKGPFPPILAQWSSEEFVIGGGVAIFHIASQRVVICSAEDRKGRTYYFLPKGRRDAGEESGPGAEREGYEESGYRNRLLPLPIKHRQPEAHPRISAPSMTAEPVCMYMMPMGYTSLQYVIYWYIAETLPPSLEAECEMKPGEAYKRPPPYPTDLKLKDRLQMEPEGYEPIHHKGTGVDEEEATYISYLLPIEEAIGRLGKDNVMSDVVRKGWRGIQERFTQEEYIDTESPEQIA